MEQRVVYEYNNPEPAIDPSGQNGVNANPPNQLFYVAEPPFYRRATVVLSKSIKSHIREFLDASKTPGNEFGPVGSEAWTISLTGYLQSRKPEISFEDVERWKKVHQWITADGVSSSSSGNANTTRAHSRTALPVGVRQPDNTATSSSPNSSAPAAAESPTSNVGTASMGASNNGTSNAITSEGEQETASTAEEKCLVDCLESVRKLRKACEDRPELRAGVVHLDPLVNMFCRSIKKRITKKTRVGMLAEDLRRSGIPQYVSGFKKEGTAGSDLPGDSVEILCNESVTIS